MAKPRPLAVAQLSELPGTRPLHADLLPDDGPGPGLGLGSEQRCGHLHGRGLGSGPRARPRPRPRPSGGVGILLVLGLAFWDLCNLSNLCGPELQLAALAAALPGEQALDSRLSHLHHEEDEDAPAEDDACEGGPPATCHCLLSCPVFGSDPSQCQEGSENEAVGLAMSAAASRSDSACESMSCIVACSRQLKCLTSVVSDRCYSVIHSTPSCSILCEDTTTTTTVTTTTITSTTTTSTTTSTKTSTTSTTTTTITTTPFNVASWTSWLDLAESPPWSWTLLAAALAVPTLLCLRRRTRPFHEAGAPVHPGYEVTPSSEAGGEALFGRSGSGVRQHRSIEEGDGL